MSHREVAQDISSVALPALRHLIGGGTYSPTKDLVWREGRHYQYLSTESYSKQRLPCLQVTVNTGNFLGSRGKKNLFGNNGQYNYNAQN